MTAREGDIALQQADGEDRPTELLLLFHGVGSSPETMRALGTRLARRRPRAWIVAVRSPEPFHTGQGWQWFSIQGIDDSNRLARASGAMPRFVTAIRHWQHASGIGPARTALIGFSQGAIMALESTQQDEFLARRVIAIAGRFPRPPRVAPAHARVHLVHGEQDAVILPSFARDAASQLEALGAQPTLDLFTDLEHVIDSRVVQRVAERLDDGASTT